MDLGWNSLLNSNGRIFIFEDGKSNQTTSVCFSVAGEVFSTGNQQKNPPCLGTEWFWPWISEFIWEAAVCVPQAHFRAELGFEDSLCFSMFSLVNSSWSLSNVRQTFFQGELCFLLKPNLQTLCRWSCVPPGLPYALVSVTQYTLAESLLVHNTSKTPGNAAGIFERICQFYRANCCLWWCQ